MSATTWCVTLAEPLLGHAEVRAVSEVLRSGWLSIGPRTAEFEAAFAARLGVDDAVAVSSGTAALHLAYHALGIGPGDEVVVPSLTFVATAAAVSMCGAVPVFADVGPDRPFLDPAAVEAVITPRTAAIALVHYGGDDAGAGAFRDLGTRHGLALVEDAAHAPAVATAGGALGTIGDVGCFSFFANKNLAVGEGGMVVAREPAVLDRVRRCRAHGMTRSSWDRQEGRSTTYDVTELGFNYRPTEIAGALGVVQLGRLDDDRRRRGEIARRYRRGLAAVDGASDPMPDTDVDRAHHLLPVTLAADVDRDGVAAALRSDGIQTSVHYPPIHHFSHYRPQRRQRLDFTERFAAAELSLPMHARLGFGDVDLVLERLGEAIGRNRR